MVELECRPQRFRKEILGAAYRPQDAHGFRFVRSRRRPMTIAEPGNNGRDAGKVYSCRNRADSASKENQSIHPVFVVSAGDNPMTAAANRCALRHVGTLADRRQNVEKW